MSTLVKQMAEQVVSLEKDRDDWKAIAEMNSEIIDRLREEIEDRDLEEASSFYSSVSGRCLWIPIDR